MAYNFPDTPTTNQVASGPNGTAYKWDGIKWAATPTSAGYLPIVGGTISGTPGSLGVGVTLPANAAAGSLFAFTGVTTGSLGGNLYWDGTGWRYLTTGTATLLQTAAGAFNWYTVASGTAGATASSLPQAMTLSATGSLGVGTTPPADALFGDIYYNSNIWCATSTTLGASLYYGSSGGWKHLSANPGAAFQMLSGTFYWYTTPTGTAGATVTPTQVMSLSANGAVFSNIVSIPTLASLYLNGATGGNPGRLYIDGSGNLNFVLPTASAGVHQFQSTTGMIAYIDWQGNISIQGVNAVKPGSTSWVNPSARDLKQDIQPYAQGLDAVLALHPVSYRYDPASGFSSDETHIGLVHDETSHMPEMHRKVRLGLGEDSEGKEVDALDASAVTFALVNALKEINLRLAALEEKLK